MNGTTQDPSPLTRPAFYEFPDHASLAEKLTCRLAGRLEEDVDRGRMASLVVSGGSTPRPLFAQLSAAALPWSRITITLADERWVEADSPDSNERMVVRELLRKHAAGAGFVGLKTGDATPEAGAQEAERRVRAVPRPFSAVALGMGSDGHTASLFPHAEGLREALDPMCPRLVMAIRPPGGKGAAALPRLTMTLPALTDSRLVVLHITGTEKRRVFERANEGDDVFSMPVRAVLRNARTPVEVWWAP